MFMFLTPSTISLAGMFFVVLRSFTGDVSTDPVDCGGCACLFDDDEGDSTELDDGILFVVDIVVVGIEVVIGVL